MRTFLIFLFFMQGFCLSMQATDMPIIPYPNRVVPQLGVFQVKPDITISLPDELLPELPLYTRLFKEKKIRVQKKKKGNIRFIKVSGLSSEAYTLDVTPKRITISYTDPSGAFYAVQTLMQLLQTENETSFYPCVSIEDEPAFKHRSFMLDEGREFKGKTEVKKLLDEMARLKMNIFHWHLCEERGWRIQIDKYPNLTEIGSRMRHAEPYEMTSDEWNRKYKEPWYYTKEDIKEIVAYASQLHIQVLPEIEIPGHAGASIMSYPWLGCASSKTGKHVREDILNVIDPKVERFIMDVIDELIPLFPMKVLHIGGDEAGYWSWEQDPKVMQFIADNNLHNPAGLQVWFINRIGQYLNTKGWRIMGWNEITGDDLRGEHEPAKITLDTTAIIHFWDGDIKLIEKSIRRGYNVVNSNRFETYLDYPYEVTPLEKCYHFQLIPQGIDKALSHKIIGFGAQMWGESAPTKERMYYLVYPRIAALAECGWTQQENKDYPRFTKALQPLQDSWRQKGYITSP